jgi:hypothetical protein
MVSLVMSQDPFPAVWMGPEYPNEVVDGISQSVGWAGCGFLGDGDQTLEGDRGPCVLGYSTLLVFRPQGAGFMVADRLCPECGGDWRTAKAEQAKL